MKFWGKTDNVIREMKIERGPFGAIQKFLEKVSQCRKK